MKKKDLAESQADNDVKKRKLGLAEPEQGRGGGPAEAAPGPNMEVEEDEWLPPPAGSDDDVEGNEWLPPPPGSDDDDVIELSGIAQGLCSGEPPEQLAQGRAETPALTEREVRQRFPDLDLPPWMFTGAGRLKAATAEWNSQEGTWAVRMGARVLTEVQEAGFLLAFEEIMKKPFPFRGPARAEARGSASSH